ncbi:conserved domain protein [marine gamma proteobacterium HTCC2148]|nr:conserved domain protein [marine gamma proteobacterium HTCC2148]
MAAQGTINPPSHEENMPAQPVYKVIFQNGNQVFEVFARQIYQSDMWGFIEVEEFVFGERSQILVDPSEEKLKNEFSGVTRSYIPLQAIIRIDEVDKEGAVKISETKPADSGNVASFPFAGIPPQQTTEE